MATCEYETSRKASFVFESFNRTKIVLSHHHDSASSLILQQKWGVTTGKISNRLILKPLREMG